MNTYRLYEIACFLIKKRLCTFNQDIFAYSLIGNSFENKIYHNLYLDQRGVYHTVNND